LCGVPGYILLPETYLPVVEQMYARRVRWETKNWALHSKLDERPVSLRDFLTRYLTRPLAMLALEPILMSMTLYISFTFGLVYLLFVVSPMKDGLLNKDAHTSRRIQSVSYLRGVSAP
jgi:DHA1 family multidrug resistance protein-like MFS transporter